MDAQDAEGRQAGVDAPATRSDEAAPTRVCPRCATQAQTAGSSCPHCGSSYVKQRMSRKAIAGILLIVLLVGATAGGMAVKAGRDRQAVAAAKARQEAVRRAEEEAARVLQAKRAVVEGRYSKYYDDGPPRQQFVERVNSSSLRQLEVESDDDLQRKRAQIINTINKYMSDAARKREAISEVNGESMQQLEKREAAGYYNAIMAVVEGGKEDLDPAAEAIAQWGVLQGRVKAPLRFEQSRRLFSSAFYERSRTIVDARKQLIHERKFKALLREGFGSMKRQMTELGFEQNEVLTWSEFEALTR